LDGECYFDTSSFEYDDLNKPTGQFNNVKVFECTTITIFEQRGAFILLFQLWSGL